MNKISEYLLIEKTASLKGGFNVIKSTAKRFGKGPASAPELDRTGLQLKNIMRMAKKKRTKKSDQFWTEVVGGRAANLPKPIKHSVPISRKSIFKAELGRG